MIKNKYKKAGGGFTFGVPLTEQPSFTFGVPGAITDIKNNEWEVTRSTKDLDKFLGMNKEKPYDFRDSFFFTNVNGIEIAKSHKDKDIYLFRGNPVYCDELDFQLYLDKPIWLSNFKVAAAYAYANGSVIGYKVSKQLNLFVLSNINNIRALLDFYKDKKEDLKVIQFATGIDLELEEHKRLFHNEFRTLYKWHEPQNGQQPIFRRVGITPTDTKLLDKIKQYCDSKGINIDGYYADELFTPMSDTLFHEEICLFSPKERVFHDRTKSKCTFKTGQNSTSWGGNKSQRVQPSKTKNNK